MTTIENFSEEVAALIMGTLLGDAHLQMRGSSYRLKIAHSQSQEEYVKWKHRKLNRLCATTQGPTARQEKLGVTIRFETASSRIWAPIHQLFYAEQGLTKSGNPKYVKLITRELIDKLPMDPLVLAVFYMDDGSVRNDCNSGKLATQGFSLEESKLLCEYIGRWDVIAQPVLHTAASGQYYITLPAATFSRFIEIIKPIVEEVPTMCYKLGRN